MTPQTKIQFTPATTYTDGTPIPAGTVLSYVALIDTVNPPIAAFPVPAADVAAETGGVITSLFTELGFKPVPGVTYFAAVTEASGAAVSADSAIVTFTYPVEVPNAPTGPSVS
jgi:hypothetical protein